MKRRIGIIEDEQAAVVGYKRYLGKRGFVVESAPRLDLGLKMLRDKPFDALVLDLKLPDGNALEALPMIRNIRRGMQIAVVSGMQDPHSAEQALTAGADRFFIKPMRISELCDDIIDMMENGATALET